MTCQLKSNITQDFLKSVHISYDKQVLMHILSPNTFLLMTSTTLFRLFTLP